MKLFEDENLVLIPLPEYYILLKDSDQLENIIEHKDEERLIEHINGIINIDQKNGIYYVDRVWATPGWGPLMHFIALYFYNENGLAPTRRKGQLKPKARTVWQKMYDDDRFISKEIDSVHGIPSLDSVYYFKGQELIEYMKNNIDRIIKPIDDNMWFETVIETKLSDEMDKVYLEKKIINSF